METSHRVAGIWNLKPRGWTLCIQLQYNLLISFSLEGVVLLTYNFVAPCTGHMENISALNYVDLPIVDLFHYTLSEKSQSLLTPSVSPEKSVFVRCWAHNGRREFSKTSFCLRVWIELSAKIAWAVFLEMTGSFGSLIFFFRKSVWHMFNSKWPKFAVIQRTKLVFSPPPQWYFDEKWTFSSALKLWEHCVSCLDSH